MPSYRKKPGDKGNFLKRRTFEEGRAALDAAHAVTQRLYCDALQFWRRCKQRNCRRHRRCAGEPFHCLLYGIIHVPQSRRRKAQKQVIAGGRRRIRPASHVEWTIRRSELKTLIDWGLA
jgi:hypothetical protein